MLSILIPIYNYNIVPLIKKLSDELKNQTFQFEIICIDDASTNKVLIQENKQIVNFKNCIYQILSKNIGRSKIRNLLVSKAAYENIIFLDSDVIPKNTNFIKLYLKELESNHVVFGGIEYSKTSVKIDEYLHYRYGKRREEKTIQERKSGNSLNFSSANFAIKKNLFKKVKFDEEIETYGFEDLLFGKNLIENNFKILQIDNPIIHLGIVTDNKEFILKEHESLKTLLDLYKKGIISSKNVRLLKYLSFLERTKLISLFKWFYKSNKEKLLKNIISKNPSLFIFDLYRLGYFSSLKN